MPLKTTKKRNHPSSIHHMETRLRIRARNSMTSNMRENGAVLSTGERKEESQIVQQGLQQIQQQQQNQIGHQDMEKKTQQVEEQQQDNVIIILQQEQVLQNLQQAKNQLPEIQQAQMPQQLESKILNEPKNMSEQNVAFKRFSFFEEISVILHPVKLKSIKSRKILNENFIFYLTSEQVNCLLNEHWKQVHIRFTALHSSIQLDEFVPSDACIEVNNRVYKLPKSVTTINNLKHLTQPIDITPFVYKYPGCKNKVNICWVNEKDCAYAVSIVFVNKCSPENMLATLLNRGLKDTNNFDEIIKNNLTVDEDCAVMTPNLTMSLICPLSKVPINIPCRASTCHHFQCFDALYFLQMNERKPKWICPYCNKPAPYDLLFIDGYFQTILSSVTTANVTKVEIHKNGDWSIPPTEKATETISEIIIISDDEI